MYLVMCSFIIITIGWCCVPPRRATCSFSKRVLKTITTHVVDVGAGVPTMLLSIRIIYLTFGVQLVNYRGLYGLVGDVIINFIDRKPSPFFNCLTSKPAFWRSPSWKRALLFVFIVRYILGFPSQKIWNKFGHEDYKLNVRCFRRWLRYEKKIMRASRLFRKLPDDESTFDEDRNNKRARARSTQATLGFSSDSPFKRKCVVDSDTTDED